MRPIIFLATSAASLLGLAGTAFAVSVEEVPNPRPQNAWVADTVDMIDASTEARLNALIDGLEQETGVEIAVVTVQEVDTATPKDFATELFNHWGIGKKESDNGLLVLMVKGERRLEMETGYGLESTLTDGWLKRMQGDLMVPRFKQGDFGQGLYDGVAACAERVRGGDSPMGLVDDLPYRGSGEAPYRGGDTPIVSYRGGDEGSGNAPLLIILGLGGVGAIGGGAAYKRRRDRTCPDCKVLMTMLPEDEDDAHLDPGQQTEERIGSVDWQYYYCENCEFSRLIPVGKWFSGYSRCGACQNKTLASSTTTISSPTYHSTGLARVTETCAHCNYHNSWTRVLPKKTPPSSSSSSGGGGFSSGGGGGSFGGGSSGGGGSGSSW